MPAAENARVFDVQQRVNICCMTTIGDEPGRAISFFCDRQTGHVHAVLALKQQHRRFDVIETDAGITAHELYIFRKHLFIPVNVFQTIITMTRTCQWMLYLQEISNFD